MIINNPLFNSMSVLYAPRKVNKNARTYSG